MNRLYIQLAGFFFSVLFLSPCLITYAQNTDNWQLPYDVDGYTVALWHFDESSGNNVTDAGPNNYNGVSTNTNIINSMNGFGNAREFQDDPTGYITFGNFNLPQFEGTLEYWVYPITRPVTPCDHSHFFTKGTHGNSGGGFTFYNRLYNDTDVDYGLGDNGGGEGRYFENAFIYNEWQHIAFTWSTEETKMYVNGELIGIMDPFPNGIGQSSDEVALGKWGSQLYTRCRYLGYVDEVRISSIERTFEPLAALVAYYPFNGNANDESGNGNHGTVNGALLTADRFGSNNSAYSFEGEDDYIELENNIDQTNYFTLSAWVHLNEYNPNPYHSAYGGNTIFARGNLTYSGQWDYIFNVNGNHHLGFVEHRANGGGYTIQADEEFPLNRWVHVVYVYDNGFAYLYQDGEQVAFRDDFQGGNTYQKDPTVIGILYRSDLGYTSEEWTGDLDDFRIYDRALTEAEILDLYHENGWPGGGSITLPFNDEFTGGPDPAWDVIGDYWFFNNDKVYSNVDQTYIYQYMIVGDNSWQDYTFEVDVLGTSGTDKAICFRVQDTQNFYMLHLIGPIQYHHIELYRYVDGQYTVIYQNPNYPVQNNVNYHLKVETYGNIIKIYINGVFEAEVTDDTFDSGGVALAGGWNGYAPCYVEFDNVSVYNAQNNNGLVAYYPFNGNANDESGNGNDGTVYGASLTTDRFNNQNSAYYFNAVDNFIEVLNDPILSPTNFISISAWAAVDDVNKLSQEIISKGADHMDGHYRMHYTAKPLQNYPDHRFHGLITRIGDNYYNSMFMGDYPLQNQWYHIVMVYNGNSLIAYLNGNQEEILNVSGNLFQNDANLYIGKHMNEGYPYFFSGKIDDIRIYDRALTETEIYDLYNEGVIPNANDFTSSFTVSDNCTNSVDLIFGTAPDATECYDPAYDLYAPPPPPSGAFDGRFVSCNEGLLKDIRETNIDSIIVWDIYYQPAAGCDPVSFSWSPGDLPAEGNFFLIDPNGGTLVNVDMRLDSSYTDLTGLDHLQILFNYTSTIGTVIADGWNMISLPLDVEDSYYKTLFPNAIDGTLFGFDGSYYSTDSIQTEEGYWLRFDGPEVVEIEGLEISMMDLDLAPGWNMIGGPLCDLALSSVLDPGEIIIPGTLFGFDGSYFTEDTIEAGKGYWIRTYASGTITLDCSNTILAKGNGRDAVLADLTEFIKVEIEDARGNNQNLYFSGKLADDVSIESYSLPPIPPSGLFDVRISGGYRLSESDEIEIKIQSKNYPLKVKMTGISNGNKDSYMIKEFAGNVEVGERQITDGLEISISNDKVNLLKIQLGSILPTRFVLEQNYPNPFNPVTQIKYGITVPNNVELIIFNALGEQVRTLVNETKEAGYYNVEWNGTNNFGVKVGSGIYLYSLRSGNNFSVKKMILLK